jgi:hypothetical protein
MTIGGQLRMVNGDWMRIRFDKAKGACRYRNLSIHTNDGCALKVGIGMNLRERLSQHRDSLDSRLRLKPGGTRDNPDDVESKGSILAKHLYYDSSVTSGYDLKSEIVSRMVKR